MMRGLKKSIRFTILFLWFDASMLMGFQATEADAAKLSYFETKIRPALHEHCLNCHHMGKASGGLMLDSRNGWQEGGNSGPAILPGKPDDSLLVRTIQHLEVGLEMPSKAPQLDQTLIDDFKRWIAEGAIDPREHPEPVAAAVPDWSRVFEERAKWWCWQPNAFLGQPSKSRGIDFWIDQKLAESQVIAAARAEPQRLVRRLSYALRGLPPAFSDVRRFEQSTDEVTWSSLIDEYLESDEFAEHWARHWMDTVRYSETHGSEDDAYLPFAYRYRDYLVRAFKQDIPLNRLIEEHLAGDLIEPRWSEEGINQALLGLAFFRFVEFNQTPVDVKKEEIVVIDSQIDAIGKAFQGITISCARCHDHKFDPISDEDYYSLYGILRSTRVGQRVLDRPEIFTQHDDRLRELQSNFTEAWAKYWLENLSVLERDLSEAVIWIQKNIKPEAKWQEIEKVLPEGEPVLKSVARLRDVKHLNGIKKLISTWIDVTDDEFATAWEQWRKSVIDERQIFPANSRILFDLTDGDLMDWRIDGAGLPQALVGNSSNWSVIGGETVPFTALLSEGYHSNVLSDRHAGVLRSPDFVIDSDAISILCRGTAGARARLVIENFQGDSLLFNTINPTLDTDSVGWITMNIRPQWKGLRAHMEFLTRDAKPYIGIIKDPSALDRGDGRSSFGILKVIAHAPGATLPDRSVIPQSLLQMRIEDRTAAIHAVIECIEKSLENLQNREATRDDLRWLNFCTENDWLPILPMDANDLSLIVEQYRELEGQIPRPHWGPGVFEDKRPVNQAWLERGDTKTPGRDLDRGYLRILRDVSDKIPSDVAGRLQLAKSITNSKNPLTARVYVNRVWNWLCGEGLVRTVDNFGRMGEIPTHPELLDELSAEFIKEGWSTKKLIRKILSSEVWRRSSAATESAKELDADNRLWSHMRVRRIEAEAIRDSLLWVAGNLKRPDSGVGTLPYYQAVMEPNKQSPSGPLSGDGRRSIYLEVRRNFPYDFLLNFDFPRPASPVGKRNTTNVATQSLTLLNDPLVLNQSKIWGTRVKSVEGDTVGKIRKMYQDSLGREPKESELKVAVELYERIKSQEGEETAWHVVAHGMFNLKEFIFLR